jgi:hypothetical protein
MPFHGFLPDTCSGTDAAFFSALCA